MLERRVVDRLVHFRSLDAPVVTVYLSLPPDPGGPRGARSRWHALLKPVRDLADSHELEHGARESLRADVARLRDSEPWGDQWGRSTAVFACYKHGLYEQVALPRLLNDRSVVNATPYVRPMLAVLDAAHRYCAVVVDREHAWLYEFFMGELEAAEKEADQALRKRNYGGWHGYAETATRNRAEQLARHHFRRTASEVEDLVQRTATDLLIVGGHHETVAEFVPFLPRELAARLAGTFTIDPHTLTPAKVREAAEIVVEQYERDEERRLVDETLDKVAAAGFAAAGLEWCLLAVDEKAVAVLLIDDDATAPGRACDDCGWLGSEGDPCPVCGKATRPAEDVIDEMSAAVIDAGGRVAHAHQPSRLEGHVVAALLRFPVPAPS
jgi:peptide chain release factor subunit 1